MVAAPPVIVTPRLRLRFPVLADADAVFAYASDLETTRFMDWKRHSEVASVVEVLRDFLDHIADGSEISWAVTIPPDDRAVGMVSSRVDGHTADLGYILHRDQWRRGFGSEAAIAVVDWLVGLPGVQRVWATCDCENVGSARVLEKTGMVREGRLRRYAIRPNIGPEPRDAFIYARVS